MYRRNKQARLLTGGLIGALPVTTPGDEHWNEVSLLIRGDTLTDLSANGHTVNEYGSTPLYNDTTTTKYASGSLTFDGTGDYISIPDDPSLELGSGDFTIECWAYHSGTINAYEVMFSKRPDAGGFTAFMVDLGTGDSKPRFLSSAGSSWNVLMTSSVTLPNDQWVHVAVTRETNTFTLWINGVSRATATASFTLMNDSTPVKLGRGYSGSPEWKGNIEDFRITKDVARYTSNFTPPTASFLTNAPVVGRRGVGGVPTALAMDTFATLDPASRTGQSMTLTDNNLTATSGSATNQNGYINADMIPGATDKIYFEFRLNNMVNQWCSVGFGTTKISYYSLETRMSKDGPWVQFNLPLLSAGDVIGCAADFQNGTAAFYNNSGNQIGTTLTGVAFAGRLPDFQLISSHSITANFGQDASFANQESPGTTYTDANGFGEFYHQPPAGFTGLYTTTTTATPLRTRGYVGAPTAIGGGGMLTLYDRYIDTLT